MGFLKDICPECGATNSGFAEKCKKCGARLGPQPAVPRSPQAPPAGPACEEARTQAGLHGDAKATRKARGVVVFSVVMAILILASLVTLAIGLFHSGISAAHQTSLFATALVLAILARITQAAKQHSQAMNRR